MTLEELKGIVTGGETLTIEFKSDVKRLPDGELVDALAAMANSQGGILFEGVEDDGSITGLCKAHLDVEGIVPLVENRTTPGLVVSVEKIDCGDGLWVGVVHVKKSKLRTNGPMPSRRDCFPECFSFVSTMKHLRYFSL